ncbi:MAG: DUF1844 domain-containing protein [Planctomycetota bacterium]|jgi:hypothetical protein
MADQEPKNGEAERTAGMPKASFLMLIAGMSTQVMMNLGELPNPVTGETAKDLDHAKYTIDLLEMLKEKTAGNLSGEEEKALDMTLYELRVKFVNHVEKGF